MGRPSSQDALKWNNINARSMEKKASFPRCESASKEKHQKVWVSPTIHFLPDGVKLQTGQEALFSRSTIFMRNGQDGEDWERQIRKELGAKGYFGLGQELWEPGLGPRTECKRRHRHAEQVIMPIIV